jgi:IclR family acetate operon transcriptional repressor
LHSSGIGKAILAAMPPAEAAKILQKRGLPRFTDRTIDTPARLREQLAEIRARGYAVDDEEYAIGLRCVAASIFDENGAQVAAVSLSGPTARITPDRVPILGALVRAVADQISAEFGGRVQPLKAS